MPEPGAQLNKSVVLIGMMGAGKTAVGRTISQKLGVPLLDSDAEIEASSQLTIAEIFARFGEPFFRQKETQVIERLLSEPPAILSTGGGAWLSASVREILRERAVVIWLDAELEILWSRVRHKSHRPLLQTSDPKATLTEIFAARTPIYAQAPFHLRIDPDWSVEQTSNRVMALMREAGALSLRETHK